MPENSKAAIKEQIPLYLIELALTAAIIGVYALLGRMTTAVILGAALGASVCILNHVTMVFSVLKAIESDSPEKGQLKMQGNYILRMLLLIAVFVLALKFLKTDPIATVLPLVLMRIALFIGGILTKKGDMPA